MSNSKNNVWVGEEIRAIASNYILKISKSGMAYTAESLNLPRHATILNNALKHVVKGCATEIFAFNDTSVFENGKSGLAFTRVAFFEKNAGFWTCLPYEQIGRMYINIGAFGTETLEFPGTEKVGTNKFLGVSLDVLITDTYNLYALQKCLEEIKKAIAHEKSYGTYLMFRCSACGECCRHLDKSEIYKSLDRGDGVCKYLSGNICTIYKDRPPIV